MTTHDSENRISLRTLIKSGAIFPLVVISTLALGVAATLVFTVNRAIGNHGLMPRPTPMESYACQGFAMPFDLDFRHGMDTVKLRIPGMTLEGQLLNGRIEWTGLAAAAPQLGFAPPTEIVYDDTNTLRLLDAGRVERICTRKN